MSNGVTVLADGGTSVAIIFYTSFLFHNWFSFRVQLAVSEDSNTAVAVKIIPLTTDKIRNESVRKEVILILFNILQLDINFVPCALN